MGFRNKHAGKVRKENVVDSGIVKTCDELDLWPWPPPPPPWVCP